MEKKNFWERLSGEDMSYLMDRNGLGNKKKAKKLLKQKSEEESLVRFLDEKAISENRTNQNLPF